MKYFLLSFILITIFLNVNSEKKSDFDLFIEWGKNNSFFMSNKIAMNYTNENIKNYYVKEKIMKNELIMRIPKKILLNIDSALNLMGSKTRKQFEAFKKTYFENAKEEHKEILKYRVDQAFLAYLMTVANKNKSKKNKIYQFYKYYFNTLETDTEKFPIFYSTEQMRLLLFSLFGNDLIQTKQMFDEEFEILQKEIYKKLMDPDEYTKYRMFTLNKLVNISGVSSIVPFIDIFETNPVNYNLYINFTNTGDNIEIISKNEININNKLILATVDMPNSGSLITYGKIFEENKNFIETFKIPKISPIFLRERNINSLISSVEVVDLTKRDYYEEIIPQYMELSKLQKEDGSKVSALRLFLENLKIMRNEYNKITPSILFKNFFKTEYVNNIKSVLDTEKNFLNKKIKEIQRKINKLAGIKELDKDL